MLKQIKASIEELKNLLKECKKLKINLSAKSELAFLKYETSKHAYLRNLTLKYLEKVLDQLNALKNDLPEDSSIRLKLDLSLNAFKINFDINELNKILNILENLEEKNISFKLNFKLPSEIKEEIEADLNELEKAYKARCFRSCIMLCGRILEIALHRKYFEATGNDLLTTAQGIGLGNLIAKLSEKKIFADPGLANQIHLINQIRVNSVHFKREPFLPTQAQANATILYTLDILEKLFK